MNTFKQAAIAVLKKAKKPLHYKEITRLALEDGLLETQGSTPEATMNARITHDIKHRKESSDFIKTAPSTFSVNPNRVDIPASKLIVEEDLEEEKIVIESSMTGKAGEFLVCSELLFRGYNASIMSVDTGLDIVATRDNKLFGIQIKTSNLNQYDTYVSTVRKVSFEKHGSNNVYYIFVLHTAKENNFLIFPFYELEKKVHEKAILDVNNKTAYRVNIKFRDNTVYLGNKDHDVSYFLNNWGIIK